MHRPAALLTVWVDRHDSLGASPRNWHSEIAQYFGHAIVDWQTEQCPAWPDPPSKAGVVMGMLLEGLKHAHESQSTWHCEVCGRSECSSSNNQYPEVDDYALSAWDHFSVPAFLRGFPQPL